MRLDDQRLGWLSVWDQRERVEIGASLRLRDGIEGLQESSMVLMVASIGHDQIAS